MISSDYLNNPPHKETIIRVSNIIYEKLNKLFINVLTILTNAENKHGYNLTEQKNYYTKLYEKYL